MDPTGRPRQLRWPTTYLTLAACVAIAAVTILASGSLLLFFLAFLAMAAMLIAGVILLIVALWTRRFPRALFVLVGMALTLSPYWTRPIAGQALDTLSLYLRRSSFDKTIADRRAHAAPGTPVRIVLVYEDRSLFVTSNNFYYVIYDETDRAQTDPSSVEGFWPCTCSTTGVIGVDGGNREIHHIAGHFYTLRMAN